MQTCNVTPVWQNLKVRKFWGLIATFVEVTGEQLIGGGGGGGGGRGGGGGGGKKPILNRDKI